MYAVFTKMETKGHFVGRERRFDTSSVASAFDRLHLAKLRGVEGQPSGTLGLVLMNTDTGKILRTHLFPVQVAVEAKPQNLKLSDAMRKALDSDESPLVGLTGKSNTLKALESRGLVKIGQDGVARRTELGNRHARKGA